MGGFPILANLFNCLGMSSPKPGLYKLKFKEIFFLLLTEKAVLM
jgi:hypothetical protein